MWRKEAASVLASSKRHPADLVALLGLLEDRGVAPGLFVGHAGVASDHDIDVGLEQGASRDVNLGSVEYLDSRWSIRAEYGTMQRDIDFEAVGGYLEAAFRLNDHWQIAARWDTSEVTLNTDLNLLPPFFSQLLEHEELALGINYWFGSKLVIRLSYSQVEGNRFAFLETPEQVGELLMTGVLDGETDLVIFGAQFSF